MAETKIHYMHDIHSGAELIFCDNSAISYPLHNHVSVFTVGMVLEGSVLLRVGQSSKIYGKDQIFAILPYVPHSITAKENYSLLSLCIRKDILSRDGCSWEKIGNCEDTDRSRGFQKNKPEPDDSFPELSLFC